VTILGAYAAELVEYGHNTQGVGGDLGQASTLAALMVGRWGMAPPKLVVFGKEVTPTTGSDFEKRLERIGKTLVQAPMPGQVPLSKDKATAEALILGQAFVIAYNAVRHNRMGIEKIVDTLLRKKEVYGDDLQRLLDGAGLEAPEVDWADPDTYPSL
jgi:ATP-dependent Zn protease